MRKGLRRRGGRRGQRGRTTLIEEGNDDLIQSPTDTADRVLSFGLLCALSRRTPQLHQSDGASGPGLEKLVKRRRLAPKKISDLIRPMDARHQIPHDHSHQVLHPMQGLLAAGRVHVVQGGERRHDVADRVLYGHAGRRHDGVGHGLMEGEDSTVKGLEDELVVAVRRVAVDGVVAERRPAELRQPLVQVRVLCNAGVVGPARVRTGAIYRWRGRGMGIE